MTTPGTRAKHAPLRLGIDLDGVVADFNAGWTKLHRDEFGSDVHPASVTTWDGLAELAGFADMALFWEWAKGNDDRPSIFRHLDPYPDAIPMLRRFREEGHRIVIVTTKPEWAVTDTFRWLADNDMPTTEVHISNRKYEVDCDIYLDDSPWVLRDLLEHRPAATVCRFVRPWNRPLDGAVDVESWADFQTVVAEYSPPS